MVQQGNETRNYSSIHDFLNSLVRTVSEVGQSQASLGEDLFVVIANKLSQSGQKLPNCRNTIRIVVTTQVCQGPSSALPESCLRITPKRKITQCSHDSINMTAKLTKLAGLIKGSKGSITPCSMTKSRSFAPSPAILSRAQTACSATTGWGEPNKIINPATAPALTTALVWSDVPDAILVRAQAESHCRSGLEIKRNVKQQLTNRGNNHTWLTCWHDWGTRPALVQHLHWWRCLWLVFFLYSRGFLEDAELLCLPCFHPHIWCLTFKKKTGW